MMMTIRCTERCFGLVGLFRAESIDAFVASIEDTIGHLAWRADGLAMSHAEALSIIRAGVLAALEVVPD
jgi:hypothetical protein